MFFEYRIKFSTHNFFIFLFLTYIYVVIYITKCVCLISEHPLLEIGNRDINQHATEPLINDFANVSLR